MKIKVMHGQSAGRTNSFSSIASRGWGICLGDNAAATGLYKAGGIHDTDGPVIEGEGLKILRGRFCESIRRFGLATLSQEEGELVDNGAPDTGGWCVRYGGQLSLESCEVLCLLVCQDAIGLCFKTSNLFGPASSVLLFLFLATSVLFFFLGEQLLVLLVAPALSIFLLTGNLLVPVGVIAADEVLLVGIGVVVIVMGLGLESELGDDLRASVFSPGSELQVGA